MKRLIVFTVMNNFYDIELEKIPLTKKEVA
jgi:hypothetical protein